MKMVRGLAPFFLLAALFSSVACVDNPNEESMAAEPTSTPTATPVRTATASPAASPSATPSPAPTPSPTATATPVRTATPTATPRPSTPTPTPTPSPTQPHVFRGKVTIDGQPAPAGGLVAALIGDNLCGIGQIGQDGVYTVEVMPESERSGCGAVGKTVRFEVIASTATDVPAPQTSNFTAGGNTPLDLKLPGAGTPTPAPTPTAPAITGRMHDIEAGQSTDVQGITLINRTPALVRASYEAGTNWYLFRIIGSAPIAVQGGSCGPQAGNPSVWVCYPVTKGITLTITVPQAGRVTTGIVITNCNNNAVAVTINGGQATSATPTASQTCQ